MNKIEKVLKHIIQKPFAKMKKIWIYILKEYSVFQEKIDTELSYPGEGFELQGLKHYT